MNKKDDAYIKAISDIYTKNKVINRMILELCLILTENGVLTINQNKRILDIYSDQISNEEIQEQLKSDLNKVTEDPEHD